MQIAFEVPIGSGIITVPASVYEAIDWNDHYRATLELLEAVFSKEVLATHYLGRNLPSRSLRNQPKHQLNPLFVDEIVKTVCEKSGVAEKGRSSTVVKDCLSKKIKKISNPRAVHQNISVEAQE
ncbi:unnamed protein product [Euphydryas editha]|uniref:BEN domain-containing protein n=1 Tax=Euphydryas editha TaxID=104508 RepID=A0AAU9TAC3_EUPED|nr:unnamed protein product [Euphydryas editha]